MSVSYAQVVEELLALVDSTPLSKIDFAPILEKYSAGLSFEEQRQVRATFRVVLTDLRTNEDISYYDHEINISTSSARVWVGNGGLIRSTLKRKEKLERIERESKTHVHVGGDFTGILAGGSVTSSSVAHSSGSGEAKAEAKSTIPKAKSKKPSSKLLKIIGGILVVILAILKAIGII